LVTSDISANILPSLSRAKVIPQVVRRQLRDHVRLILEAHALSLQLAVHGTDVGDLVVENRRRVLKLGLLGDVEHEAHAAAVGEAERPASGANPRDSEGPQASPRGPRTQSQPPHEAARSGER
jgi:hypothetical protein